MKKKDIKRYREYGKVVCTTILKRQSIADTAQPRVAKLSPPAQLFLILVESSGSWDPSVLGKPGWVTLE